MCCGAPAQLEFSGFTLSPLLPQYIGADGCGSRETLVTHVIKARCTCAAKPLQKLPVMFAILLDSRQPSSQNTPQRGFLHMQVLCDLVGSLHAGGHAGVGAAHADAVAASRAAHMERRVGHADQARAAPQPHAAQPGERGTAFLPTSIQTA